MKFKVATKELKKALDTVNHAVSSVSTTPILENILIKVNFDNVVLISNNLETAIEYVIKDNIEIFSEWAICITSKLFTQYINLLQDDEVELELIRDIIEITSVNDNFKIKWIEASEFPLIPTIREETSFNIDSKIFIKAISKTLFSSAEWNIRPTLAGILFNINWSDAIFASTDSFRLTEYKTKLEDNINSFSWIIPSKTASEIKSILSSSDFDKVKIISWDNWIAFFFWNTKFFSRLLNWKFPDYSTFFPTKWSTKSEINRIDLIQALKKINLLSKENNYAIKMSFSSEFWIILETNETQIWEWQVRLSWVVEWEDAIIWINSIFFLEVLWVIETSHISISFESALAPILITPLSDPEKETKDEFRHIIMPLKI